MEETPENRAVAPVCTLYKIFNIEVSRVLMMATEERRMEDSCLYWATVIQGIGQALCKVLKGKKETRVDKSLFYIKIHMLNSIFAMREVFQVIVGSLAFSIACKGETFEVFVASSRSEMSEM
jgi:hypothetical protein